MRGLIIGDIAKIRGVCLVLLPRYLVAPRLIFLGSAPLVPVGVTD